MLRLRSRRAAPLLGALLTAALAACDAHSGAARRGITAPDAPALAVVPAKGTAATLDVAGWNIEWFGSTGNGPTNETLQLNNARDIISGTDFDIWGVAEITGQSAWNNLESQLTGYTGFLASESVVTSGSTYYGSTEQKVGILYKSSIATLLGARIILTAYNTDFAGRPPLEVKLRVTLNGATEDIVVIVLHAKAFNDDASWQKRLNASNALKSYLDAAYPTQKVIVVGDWNDDVDTSITAGKPSPYQNFVDDAADYAFPTRALSLAGISSTTSYSDMIDHHLNTNEMYATLVAASTEVYRVDSYVSSYDATTSDHFPVLSRYTFGSGGTTSPAQVILNEILANEPGSNTALEFVEIVNVGGTAIGIGGWTLSDGAGVKHTFASGTTLDPGKAIVVYGAASGIPAGLTNAVAASTGSLALGNSGDSVILKNGTTTVTSYTYPSSLSGTDGVSMNRSPDVSATGSWVLHTTISSLASSGGTRANGTAF